MCLISFFLCLSFSFFSFSFAALFFFLPSLLYQARHFSLSPYFYITFCSFNLQHSFNLMIHLFHSHYFLSLSTMSLLFVVFPHSLLVNLYFSLSFASFFVDFFLNLLRLFLSFSSMFVVSSLTPSRSFSPRRQAVTTDDDGKRRQSVVNQEGFWQLLQLKLVEKDLTKSLTDKLETTQ